MAEDAPTEVTILLARWRNGDRDALDALMPLVYDELRRLARHYLSRERNDHTLQSTALVHEAFVRLVGQKPPDWTGRAHFMGVAARLMRQILVDHARAHAAGKRGGGYKLALHEDFVRVESNELDLLQLDEALRQLAHLDPQQSRVVELRYFAGLSVEDASEVLGISPATVKREWASARAFLQREMARGAGA